MRCAGPIGAAFPTADLASGTRHSAVGRARARSLDRLIEVVLVHLDADEAHAQFGARDGGRPETEERIGDDLDAVEAVEPQAHLRELGRESRRMGPVLFAALDRLVGDEPRIAAAAHAGRGGPPAADVRLVLIANPDGLPIDRRVARRGEVKDELVAVVHEAAAVDRLVVTHRQVVFEVGAWRRRVTFRSRST